MSYFSSLEKYAQLNGFRKYTCGEGKGAGSSFFCIILGIVLYHNVTRISLPNIIQTESNSTPKMN